MRSKEGTREGTREGASERTREGNDYEQGKGVNKGRDCIREEAKQGEGHGSWEGPGQGGGGQGKEPTRICASLGSRMKFKTLCYPVFGRHKNTALPSF